jgi:ketosteroid isomerase-like protein
MKTIKFFSALAIIIALFSTTGFCQTKLAYKDAIVDNPNAEADIKVVGDFMKACVSGDLDKAKSLLAPNYKGRGPSSLDSTNVEKTMATWQANYKIHSNRKVGFVAQTFRSTSGSTKGDWVSVWGTYTFTQMEKTIQLPFQYTAKVADGKIVGDLSYFDNLSVARQLGYKVTPPETAKK